MRAESLREAGEERVGNRIQKGAGARSRQKIYFAILCNFSQ